ncbi:MAG TPA: DUF2272 domain-containing protein [Vicinamibacterales bacterium]
MLALPLAVVLVALSAASETDARQTGLDRLPPTVFDVVPPSAHVRGAPGKMVVQPRACRTMPTGETRRRMVDVAVQEWGFFGFRIVDRTEVNDGDAFGNEAGDAGGAWPDLGRGGRRLSRLPPEEAARVAASIAGYWAVTPEGSWIVERQNEEWNGPDGTAVRWNAPWSAAFVSWVMCEAGLGAASQFQRAIAHHAYIDQAIRARDGRAPQAAFAAYDAGETAITPGDLLCSSRRPAYRTIADRRRQMGIGARSHCDVVVKVDEARERILAIGGNVRGAVSLKLLRGNREPGKPLRLVDMEEDRPIFAHLKLRADPIDTNALDTSPTVKAFGCVVATRTSAFLAAANVTALGGIAARC